MSLGNYWAAMILTGAPRSVTGKATIDPIAFPAASLAGGARPRADAVLEDIAQLRRHLGRLGELVMVGRVVGLDIG